jgi:hypothetical protein
MAETPPNVLLDGDATTGERFSNVAVRARLTDGRQLILRADPAR